ncbi:unnamed protein product [Phytomonas sp. EM1]|nr:unnamed protein product [Phytomonas sp. EM1]|eukprot:CCW60325.1 unnamed protein product [Phytomonas sp. isolate EM1]
MYTNEQLLSANFDSDAYLKHTLHVSNISAEQARLTVCLNEVKDNIHSILSEHSEGMINQLKATYKVQHDVTIARQSTDSIVKATSRLKLMIEDPYLAIRDKIQELDTTKNALDALRQVQRFLSLSARLQEHKFATDADLIRTARILSEMENLSMHSVVRGIDIVEPCISLMERTSTALRNKIHELLSMPDIFSSAVGEGYSKVSGRNGEVLLFCLNKVMMDVGTALQCGFTLGMLSRVVHNFMIEHKREVIKTIVRELDLQSIAGALGGLATSKVNAAGVPGDITKEVSDTQGGTLMDYIQSVLYVVVQHTQCILVLWQVLLRKQDSVTHASFIAMLDTPVQLLMDYWNTVMDKLRERLVALQKQTNMQAILVTCYPRLHMLLESFVCSSESFVEGGVQQSDTSSLPLHYVRQWGMGDYLDFVQHVELEVSKLEGNTTHAKNDNSNSSSMNIKRIRQVWLLEIVKGLQPRFAAQMINRHRNQLLPSLAMLSTITPSSMATGNQPISVPANVTGTSGRHRAPTTPLPQTNTIELSAYTHAVVQECYTYRQDPHTLLLSVECVLKCLAQLYEKFKESAVRFPLPPLPAVTSVVTRAQLMHISIANACTTLVNDFANLITLLPDDIDTPGAEKPNNPNDKSSSEDLGMVVGDWPQTLRMLCLKRRELHDQIQAFRVLSEESSCPFLDSMNVVLLSSVSLCVEGYLSDFHSHGSSGSGNVSQSDRKISAILELQKLVDVFIIHFYHRFDPRTSNLGDRVRQLIDSQLSRLLVSVAVMTRRSNALNSTNWCRCMLQCVSQVEPILLSIASSQQDGQGRSTLLLRGAVHRLMQFYNAWSASLQTVQQLDQAVEQIKSILKPLYPLASRLLLLQRLSFAVAPAIYMEQQGSVLSVTATLGWSPDELAVCVESGLRYHCDASLRALTECEVAQLAKVEKAVQTCFDASMKNIQNQDEADVLSYAWQQL